MSNTPEYLRKMDDKVREIGKYLGMEFDEEYAQKHERDYNYWSHLKNGTKGISFHTSDYKLKDRWQIRAEFPRDDKGRLNTGYNQKWPEITVAMSKGPEKIAKDIKSRLLPGYEKQLADVIARNESANRYVEGRLTQICKVADFLGMERPDDDSKTLYPPSEKGVYRIAAYSDNSVKFEVEVDADRAIEVLKILGYGPDIEPPHDETVDPDQIKSFDIPED